MTIIRTQRAASASQRRRVTEEALESNHQLLQGKHEWAEADLIATGIKGIITGRSARWSLRFSLWPT